MKQRQQQGPGGAPQGSPSTGHPGGAPSAPPSPSARPGAAAGDDRDSASRVQKGSDRDADRSGDPDQGR